MARESIGFIGGGDAGAIESSEITGQPEVVPDHVVERIVRDRHAGGDVGEQVPWSPLTISSKLYLPQRLTFGRYARSSTSAVDGWRSGR